MRILLQCSIQKITGVLYLKKRIFPIWNIDLSIFKYVREIRTNECVFTKAYPTSGSKTLKSVTVHMCGNVDSLSISNLRKLFPLVRVSNDDDDHYGEEVDIDAVDSGGDGASDCSDAVDSNDERPPFVMPYRKPAVKRHFNANGHTNGANGNGRSIGPTAEVARVPVHQRLHSQHSQPNGASRGGGGNGDGRIYFTRAEVKRQRLTSDTEEVDPGEDSHQEGDGQQSDQQSEQDYQDSDQGSAQVGGTGGESASESGAKESGNGSPKKTVLPTLLGDDDEDGDDSDDADYEEEEESDSEEESENDEEASDNEGEEGDEEEENDNDEEEAEKVKEQEGEENKGEGEVDGKEEEEGGKKEAEVQNEAEGEDEEKEEEEVKGKEKNNKRAVGGEEKQDLSKDKKDELESNHSRDESVQEGNEDRIH